MSRRTTASIDPSFDEAAAVWGVAVPASAAPGQESTVRKFPVGTGSAVRGVG